MVSVAVLGAVVEIASRHPGSSPGFSVREFADLDDGRRVWWRTDRGWGGSARSSNSDWPVSSGRDMAAEVIQVTEPYELGADAYVACVVWGLKALGLQVDVASVWAAPYVVEHGPLLQAELQRVARSYTPPDPPDLVPPRRHRPTGMQDQAVAIDPGASDIPPPVPPNSH